MMAHESRTDAALNTIERELIAMLRARRWSIGRVTREAQNLILTVAFEDQEGSVRVLYATQPEDPCPAFVRFELGQAGPTPTTWSAWEVIGSRVDEDDDESDLRFREVCQGAFGPGWCVVGLGIWPAPTPEAWPLALNRVIPRVERLSPSRDDQSRHAVFDDFPHAMQRVYRERRAERWALVVMIVLAFAAILGTVFAVQAGSLELAGLALMALMWIVGLTALVAVVKQRDRRERVGAWDSAIAMLQSAGVFDQIERGASVELLGIPVLGEVDDGRALGWWPMRQEVVKAASSRHPLRAEVVVARVDFPKNTLELCRIVPDAFVSIGFIGPQASLSSLPPWPRTKRKRGRLYYIFTSKEVESGKMPAWLTKAITPQKGQVYRELP